MSRRRLLWGLLAVALVSGVVFDTGGFDTASMDRGVSVGVAATQERGLVALEAPASDGVEPSVQTNTDGTATLVVVRNRFDDQHLDVVVTDRAGSPLTVDWSRRNLAPGESAAVVVPLDCSAVGGTVEIPLDVRVDATDGSVEGDLAHTVTVTCPVDAAMGTERTTTTATPSSTSTTTPQTASNATAD